MNIYWKKVEGGSTQEFAEIEDYIDEDVPVFVPNPRKKVMIRDLFWIAHPTRQLGALSKRELKVILYIFFSVQPSVDILKPPYELYQIKNGEELALVCRGHGDPMPTLSWRRQVLIFFSKQNKRYPFLQKNKNKK